ncbi:MAG TPA: DUF502 domain-containing protein [Longimicrobiales bacterium]|nr:DUF502 domain-containing protein [Longimicrobiales bacterium]
MSRTHGRFWRLRTRMASGLVALVPIVVTVYVLRLAFAVTSGILLPVIDPAVREWPELWRAGLSLAILIVAVYLLGEIATRTVGRRILGVGEAVLLRVPFVKVVYSASKQVVEAFQSPTARAFKSVVFLEFPRPGTRAVGFVTSSITRPDGSVWNTVFVPTTPNPTTGFLQVVPEVDLEKTDMTVEEGIKMIMSLGVLVPGRIARPG